MKLFVTGTDTGVGKTAISAALLAAARRRGLVVRGIKPVESGCRPGPDGLEPLDAIELARAAGHEPLCCARFAAPVSPARAAELAGEAVSSAELLEFVASHAAGFTVVEGAGGLLAPLAGDSLYADFAVALGAPVLVVARDALGTINHTLLTIEALRARHLELCGVVLSGTHESAEAEANAEQIRAHGGVPVWRVPYAELSQRAAAVEPLLDELSLARYLAS